MVEQRVQDALKIADWTYVLVGGKVALSESASAFRERPDAARWLMGMTRKLERPDTSQPSGAVTANEES
jgi:ABC-type lipopolysaccharide export system ATPase subunit